MVLPKIGLDVKSSLSRVDKWNFHILGIGVGGHCIPVDPYYYLDLSEKVGKKSLISTAARSINESMPSSSALEVLSLIDGRQINSPKVLILGYSYKPETGDVRDTRWEFSHIIASSGAKVLVCDPFVEEKYFPEWVNTLNSPTEGSGFDMVVLATAHSSFMKIDWENLRSRCNNALIYDGRRVLSSNQMRESGWEYYGIGYPSA